MSSLPFALSCLSPVWKAPLTFCCRHIYTRMRIHPGRDCLHSKTQLPVLLGYPLFVQYLPLSLLINSFYYWYDVMCNTCNFLEQVDEISLVRRSSSHLMTSGFDRYHFRLLIIFLRLNGVLNSCTRESCEVIAIKSTIILLFIIQLRNIQHPKEIGREVPTQPAYTETQRPS